MPKDPDNRRPRSHWDDDRRAEIGRDRRSTPARGVVVTDERERDRNEITPVTDVLDLIEDPQLRRIVRLIWEHTANSELRSMQRVPDEADIGRLRTEVGILEREFRDMQLELTGKDGTNGKVGSLRGAVEKLLSRAWWFFTVAVGGIGAAAIKLIVVGRAYGELETQCQANTARVQLLEQVVFLKSQPAAGAAPTSTKGEQ